jgi:L-fuculokinase
MKPSATVVLDIGKTHVKLCALDADDKVLAVRTRDNAGVQSPAGYAALDTGGIESWLWDSLASVASEFHIRRIITSTHGAAFAAIDANGLVLPIVDYEFDAYAGQRDAYAEAVGDLRETLSPHLPMGLNAARPLYWLARECPHEFAQATTLLPYPQYWAWRLSGVAASEASSLGCHTHLWAPVERSWSRLARAEGWDRRFAPLRSAWEVLGPVRPELSQRLGLPVDCLVHVGVHDSNACLARHLRRSPAMTLVTSGTWTVVMACGGQVDRLDLSADMLANVSVAQDLVPTARFMGGRDHAALCAGADPDAADLGCLPALAEAGVEVLPSTDGSRPRVVCRGDDITAQASQRLTPVQRATLAAHYCAAMTAERVQALSGPSPVVVEGPLARNAAYLALLAQWLPKHRCQVGDAAIDGTVLGALALTRWND